MTRSIFRTSILGVICLGSFIALGTGVGTGCSSESTSSAADGGSTAIGDPITQRVTAAAGGTVAAPGGKGSLAIPAGALAADTDITLALATASNGSVSEVFEFGPSGTTFKVPAELSIKLDPAVKAPEGKTFALAVEESGSWKALEGSSVTADGNVKGSVSHFSKFAIIFVDGKALISSACESEVAAFVACGGDPKGTWEYKDLCFKQNPLGSGGSNTSCPEATASIDLELTGTITIDATNIVISDGTQTTTTSLTSPKSCIPGGLSCADYGAQVYKDKDGGPPKGSCTESGDKCTCSGGAETKTTTGNTQPYTVTGTTFTTGDGGAESGTPFCVKGDLLYISDTKPNGTVTILKRKI